MVGDMRHNGLKEAIADDHDGGLPLVSQKRGQGASYANTDPLQTAYAEHYRRELRLLDGLAFIGLGHPEGNLDVKS